MTVLTDHFLSCIYDRLGSLCLFSFLAFYLYGLTTPIGDKDLLLLDLYRIKLIEPDGFRLTFISPCHTKVIFPVELLYPVVVDVDTIVLILELHEWFVHGLKS